MRTLQSRQSRSRSRGSEICLFVALASCARAGDSDGAEAGAGDPPSAQIAACIDQNPVSNPFDLGDTPVPAPAPSESGAAAAPSANSVLDAIAAQCAAAGGERCDAARFISKDAAICVSEQAGVADADTWTASLELRSEEEPVRVEWLVLGHGPGDGRCCTSGWFFRIDATTGQVISHTDEQEVCCTG